MENILFLAYTEADGSLAKGALETLGAAKDVAMATGAKFSVGLIGGEVQNAANAIAACGAEKFYGVAGAEFAQSRYATDTAAARGDLQGGESDTRDCAGKFAFRRACCPV